ncbi:hypothetical protein AB0L41_31820 [Amycolatopsis mediterranei]|uniref:hypothetical protein n=1 Tax=Amycolatopsis mediterranei TaxID=33910 RepID=UPI00342ABE05
MKNARPMSRRRIEAATDDLGFDYFADSTGLAGDGVAGEDFGRVAELVGLYAEIAEIEETLAELEAPVARVIALPIVAPCSLGEVA